MLGLRTLVSTGSRSTAFKGIFSGGFFPGGFLSGGILSGYRVRYVGSYTILLFHISRASLLALGTNLETIFPYKKKYE